MTPPLDHSFLLIFVVPHALILQQLRLFLLNLQTDLLDALEKRWLKGDFISFSPGQMQLFTLVLYFLLILPLNGVSPPATSADLLWQWDKSRINFMPTFSHWPTPSLPHLLLSLNLPSQKIHLTL